MTVYSRWPAWAAWLLLLLGLALVAAAALPHIRPRLTHLGPAGYDDRFLQRSIADRVAGGDNYYAAAAAEQRANFYPTAPAPVFREPTLTWFLAVLRTQPVRRVALLALLAAAIIAMRERLDRTTIPRRWRFATMLLQASGFAIAWHGLQVYQHETWAALLMALSLALYRPERYWPSICIAVLACLVRELALPMIWAMAAFAAWERRWRETAAWAAAMVLFLSLLAVHLHVATGFHQPGDIARSGWFYGGGWDFVVETARNNALLYYCPAWAVAAAAWLGLVGLAGWRDPWVARLAAIVGGYMAAFLFFGRPDNQYWGYLYAPLLPLGWALAPAALRDLAGRAVPWMRAGLSGMIYSRPPA